MKGVFHFFCLFFLLFDVHIPGFPNGVGSSALMLPFFIVVFFMRPNLARLTEIFNVFLPIVAVHFLIILYVFLRLLLGGASELSMLLAVAKNLVLFCAVFMYWVLYFVPESKTPELIIKPFFINALICFAAGSIPILLEYVRLFQIPTDNANLIPYRNAFISGSGFFTIGSAYGLAFVFLSYIYLVRVQGVDFVRVFQLLVIFSAGFIAARTSLVALIAVSFMLIVCRAASFWKMFFLMFALLILFFSIPGLDKYNVWLFELFIKGKESGTLQGLMNHMYFVPELSTLLFGDGVHSVMAESGSYYGGSDVGYMRNIFFGGIPYLLIMMLFPLLMFVRLWRVSSIFALAVLFVMLVFHGKGAFFYNNSQGMAVFYMFYAFFYSSRVPGNSELLKS